MGLFIYYVVLVFFGLLFLGGVIEQIYHWRQEKKIYKECDGK